VTAEVRARLGPTLGPGAWIQAALDRLDADPVAGAIAAVDRVGIARAAWDAGARLAIEGRRPWGSTEAALAASGVAVDEDDADPSLGPLVHHAVYSAPPPRVRLYRRAIDVLEPLVDAAGARAAFGAVTVREVVLAHELFHHLIHVGPAPAAIRPHVVVFTLGPWKRRVVVRAAEEIGAAGFSAAWTGVPCAPGVVDALTRFVWSDRAPAPREEICHGR
jgi:hypothetical protein